MCQPRTLSRMNGEGFFSVASHDLLRVVRVGGEGARSLFAQCVLSVPLIYSLVVHACTVTFRCTDEFPAISIHFFGR